MGKFKSQSLARIPKDQRCQFLIGPISSWFMPNTSDLWTRPLTATNTSNQCDETDSMEAEENSMMSYFVYGSIGCFCYGEILKSTTPQTGTSQNQNLASMSAIVSHLVDIKEDNSRVSCIRFLKPALFPIIMALTESGSLIIHDCVKDEKLIHLRKTELISKFVDSPIGDQDTFGNEHHNKKTKFNVIQQINSCSWPNATNAFLGISLLKEKTNLLIWMKLRDLTAHIDSQVTKSDLIESHSKLDLDLPQYSSPICCMETILIDEKSCLLAVAMDDGLIKIVLVNFDEGQTKRVITLARHNDQICSMSLFLGDRKRFPLGLLASISRDGLTLLWDIENEFYFADYQAGSGGATNSRINWFALSFVSNKETNQTKLAVSNSESGLTVLDIPENTRSKIRLKEPAKEKQLKGTIPDIRHQALIFDVIFDPVSGIIMTSSLDGNHILWFSRKLEQPVSKRSIGTPLQMKSQYLIPSLPNNSRVHMMRHSPIQESLLGICLGKAGVRFYRITENLAQSKFDMSPGAAMIARKITKASLCPTSLSWHPRNEYRVAIGTIEGKVLRVDLTPTRSNMIESEYRKPSSRAPAELMSVDHDIKNEDDFFDVDYQPISREAADGGDSAEKNQNKTDGIYSVCWGPNPTCPQDENRSAIYAVSSTTHRLFIYYSNKDSNDKLTDYLEEFLDESLPEAIGEASEVAWKSTLDLMALGTTHGKVIIVEYLEESHADRSRNRLFRKLAVIKEPMGTTYIQCLAWHPTLDENDARYHHIACSANDSPVYVFDIGKAKDDNNLASDVKTKLKIENGQAAVSSNTVDEAKLVILSDYLHKLDAHKKPISDVAWNPHNPNQLATCSFDRTCYVWSLDDESSSLSSNSARLHSKFCARDRLFTLEWSLVDDDLLYTSGHDSTVWAWRPSENLNKTNTETQS